MIIANRVLMIIIEIDATQAINLTFKLGDKSPFLMASAYSSALSAQIADNQ